MTPRVTAAQEYFHCRTGAVIRKDEASLVDSDDDVDTTWIQKQNEDLMEEFTDVSSDEKTFMKLWNDFMQVRALARCAAPAARPGLFSLSLSL
jgi:hypothetical protein